MPTASIGMSITTVMAPVDLRSRKDSVECSEDLIDSVGTSRDAV